MVSGIMQDLWAEEFARPSYKWIGPRQFVRNLQAWKISVFPGGIGFSFYNYSDEKALRVRLYVERQDGATEGYLSDAYYCGEWGGGWQKWQSDKLPLFPYESLHGPMRRMTFSYGILKDGISIPSRYTYRFASLEDFHRGFLPIDDFNDPDFMNESNEAAHGGDGVQRAYDVISRDRTGCRIVPFFTRGEPWRGDHPLQEIHKAIDRVIARKLKEPQVRRHICLAMYDLDNEHVSKHLAYARGNGVEVECIGDWARVSSMNATEHVARLRRAGIPVYGVVRNNPACPGVGIPSMHTKFILFDDDVVHSGSYNLHFHLWGGNWENSLIYHSREAATLYTAVYEAIKTGHKVRLHIDTGNWYNLYYTFGSYLSPEGAVRPQDVIVSEIDNANSSITLCMFDLSHLVGFSLNRRGEADVIDALIRARDRGVRVQILVNGMMAHSDPQPEPWDKDFRRPLKPALRRLKDAWIEIYLVYYWESIYSPLHHKFAVIDGRTVITESYNWCEPSSASDEVVSVVRDAAIAARFIEESELILRRFRIVRG